MKRYLILLLLLAGCTQGEAQIIMGIAGGAKSAGTTPCQDAGCDGTYLFCWTGDYTGSDVTAGKDSGSSTIVGTENGTVEIEAACGQTGSGICLTGLDEGLEFAVTAENIIDFDVGTIWMTVYAPDLTGEADTFEASDGSASDYVRSWVSGTNRYNGTHRGTSDTNTLQAPASQMNLSDWTRVMFTWDIANDDLRICSDLDKDGVKDAGECTINEAATLVDETSALTEFVIGESHVGAWTSAETIKIDDVIVLPTYDAADPDPI